MAKEIMQKVMGIFGYSPTLEESYHLVSESFQESKRLMRKISDKQPIGLEEVLSKMPEDLSLELKGIGKSDNFSSCSAERERSEVIAGYFENLRYCIDHIGKKLFGKFDVNSFESVAIAERFAKKAERTLISNERAVYRYYRAVKNLNVALMLFLNAQERNSEAKYESANYRQSASN